MRKHKKTMIKGTLLITIVCFAALIFMTTDICYASEATDEAVLGYYSVRTVYIDGLIYETYPEGITVYDTNDRRIEPIPQDTSYPKSFDFSADGTCSIQFLNQEHSHENWILSKENCILMNDSQYELLWISGGRIMLGDKNNGAVYEKRSSYHWDIPKHVGEQLYINDVLLLGNYKQKLSDAGIEPIEWVIIKHDGARYLLMSRYIIEFMQFDYNEISTWDESTIRRWLNGDFLSSFSDAELSLIEPVNISSLIGRDRQYDEALDAYLTTYHASETEDKVFLLSQYSINDETDQYTKFTGMSLALYDPTPTEYVAEKSGTSDVKLPYFYRDTDGGNALTSEGTSVPANSMAGIRPLLWINTESLDKSHDF